MATAEAVWTQPKVYVGQEVLFFPHGDRGEANPARAIVMKVWPDVGCRLALVGGGIATTHTQKVRHLDDPYFLSHPFARQNDGAWDNTEYVVVVNDRFEAMAALIADLSEQVSSLEAIVEGLTSKK